MRTRKGMRRARGVRSALVATVIGFLVVSILPSGVSAGPVDELPVDDVPVLFPEDDPAGEVCYLVADYTDETDDTDQVSQVDTGLLNPPNTDNENPVGSPGTQEAESAALHPVTGALYSADADHLMIIDKEDGHVITHFPPFGTGNGSAGTVQLKDIDGISFDPETSPPMLFASARRSSPTRDLLFQVDPETGAFVPGAFNGADYVVVDPTSDPTPTSPSVPNLDDVDDVSFGGNDHRIVGGPFDGRLKLWALINRNGQDPHLVVLNRDGDPALYAGGFTGSIEDIGSTMVPDTEGLGWGQEALWATTGKAAGPGNNHLWKVDPNTGAVDTSELRLLSFAHDYEGIACPPVSVSVKVIPPGSINRAGDTHTFTVEVKVNGQPVFGGEPEIIVDPPEDEVSNTCETPPGTDVNGQCTVTIHRNTVGVTRVTAIYEHVSAEGVPPIVDQATGVKVWVDLTKCPVNAVDPTTAFPYQVTLQLPDTPQIDLDQNGTPDPSNVTVTDDLPPELIFLGASAMNGFGPTSTPPVNSPNGQVVWKLPLPLAAGTYTATIDVQLAPGIPEGTEIVNTVTASIDGDNGPGVVSQHIMVSTNEADSRAFGVRADILGGGLILGDPDIEATPDSDVTNPDELLAVPNPAAPAGDPLVRLLHVSESDTSTASEARASARASTAEVDVNLPGVLQVEADAVVAQSESFADATTAGSTAAGSTIVNLRVNGVQHGDISEPVTITVNDPISGNLLAEVYVLQRIPGGAAAGVIQPDGGKFQSSLTVNGIHVVVHDIGLTPIDESSDIIVAHAESSAEFTALTCPPSVSGDAHILSVFNVNPDLASVLVGDVLLPSTGGSESEHLTDIDLPVIGTIDTATAETTGTVEDNPASAEAFSQATVEDANLLGGVITATLVRATAEADLNGASGDTVIADVEIAGTNLCAALMLASTCEPAPDTDISLPAAGVIIRLNEQIPDATPHGITVNAIHIFVVGEGNPLGLPVGAEVIISQAHADAHPFRG